MDLLALREISVAIHLPMMQFRGTKVRTNLHNINVIGSGPRTAVMAHGFGCDQNMWRFLTPIFEQSHRMVLFDYTGSGKSDASQFSVETPHSE